MCMCVYLRSIRRMELSACRARGREVSWLPEAEKCSRESSAPISRGSCFRLHTYTHAHPTPPNHKQTHLTRVRGNAHSNTTP